MYRNYKNDRPTTLGGLIYEQRLEQQAEIRKRNKDRAEYIDYQFETIVSILKDFNENIKKLAEKPPATVINLFTCKEDPTELIEALKSITNK